MNRNIHLLSVAAAYTAWGILPLFWHLLSNVPGTTIVGARILFSLLFLTLVLSWSGKLGHTVRELYSWERFKIALPSALLIGGNWLVYLWAMTHGKMMEAGLGYCICPIVTMIFGSLICGERLSERQKLGALLIGGAVLFKVLTIGGVPWIGLGLAVSFASYLVIRKQWPVDPFTNMFHEMAILAPPALALVGVGSLTLVLDNAPRLFLTGPITVLPMAALVFGMRSVSLQTGALLQYLNPGLTIVMGVLTGEAINVYDAVCFAMIVLGIMLHAIDGSRTFSVKEDLLSAGLATPLAFTAPTKTILKKPRQFHGQNF